MTEYRLSMQACRTFPELASRVFYANNKIKQTFRCGAGTVNEVAGEDIKKQSLQDKRSISREDESDKWDHHSWRIFSEMHQGNRLITIEHL